MKSNLKKILFISLTLTLSSFFFTLKARADVPCPNNTIFGVTTESVERLDKLKSALKKIRKVCIPTVRVVFQYEEDLDKSIEKYLKPLEEIRGSGSVPKIAYVMGLLVDSQQIYHFNNKATPVGHKDIGERARKFAEALGAYVDIWEIGNEMNATWVGWNLSDKDADGRSKYEKRSEADLREMRGRVGQQIIQVYRVLRTHPKVKSNAKIALNLYFYDNECGDDCREVMEFCKGDCAKDYEMIQWSTKYLSPEDNDLKFDYVFFSYYSDDCLPEDVPISDNTWIKTFENLNGLFSFGTHTPKVGFGEIGKQCKCNRRNGIGDDRSVCRGDCRKLQTEYITKYYGEIHLKLKTSVPNYVGGFFYWTFFQDATVEDDIGKAVLNSFLNTAGYWK